MLRMLRYLAPKLEKFKLLLTLDLCYSVTMSNIKNLNIPFERTTLGVYQIVKIRILNMNIRCLIKSIFESSHFLLYFLDLKINLEIFYCSFIWLKQKKINMLRMMLYMLRKMPKNLFWTSFQALSYG